MSRDEAKATEVLVAKLAELLAADARLRPELLRARREFFGAEASAGAAGRGATGLGAGVGAAASAAEHRFAEWFALERSCDTLGDVPVELPSYAAFADDLAGSLAGVFLVQGAIGGAVSARDLQDETVLDLRVPPQSLREGDLLVGRLFPSGPDLYTPSTACAVFRPGADLGRAFARDLQRLELDRRLQQIELEHLLLRRPEQGKSPTADPRAPAATNAPPPVPLEHLEADLERLLRDGGSDLSASSLSQQLALVQRPGQIMGPLLEELAFDTEVDLDRLRDLMLQIWNAHHLDDEPAAPASDDPLTGAAPGETLGERLVRTLDEGLAQKRDVEDLFAQLERMAGIEPEREDGEEAEAEPAGAAPLDGASWASAADDDEEDYDEEDEDGEEDADDEQALRPARGTASPRRAAAASEEPTDDEPAAAYGDPDAGDLVPLVEEYLWETGRDRADSPLRLWTELQRNAPLPRMDLEQVTAGDLMRLLLHVYLGAPPPARAEAVRTAFAELRAFYDWAHSTQELDFGAVLDQCHGSLLSQLDRLHTASHALSNAQRPAGRPGILEVEDVGADGFGVRDDDGGTYWIRTAPTFAAELLVGDLVLGALSAATAGPERTLQGLVVVLPAEARQLME